MKRKVPFETKASKSKKFKYSEIEQRRYMPLYYGLSKSTEKKFVDTTVAVGALAATSITVVNGIATGTDYNTRIGREILMKSVYLRLTAYNGTDQDAGIRIMLVYDKQPNGAAPAITDLLVSGDLVSANNLNNKDRFVTISDRVRKISTASDRGFFHKKYKSLQTHTQYGNTGNTIASITSGALFLILIPINNNNGASTANFNVGYNCRVRFIDK